MRTSRRNLLAGIALGLPLAACGKSPFTIDPSTVNVLDLARAAAKGFCGILGVLPTDQTLAQIIAALGLPAGIPVEQIAAQVAHTFCDHIQPLMARRGVRRRGIEPSTGKVILDYGPVVINGKQVNITVYAP